MLSGIIDGIKAIANAITTAIGFLFQIVEDTARFVGKLIMMPVTVYNYIDQFFPAWIVALIVAIIATVLIVRVIGRD